MAGKGFPPRPLEVQRALGVKVPENTLPVTRISPTPPRGLGKRGREFWRHVSGLRWVASTDAPALLEACQIADLVEAARADLEQNGLWYESRGRRFQNPAAAQYWEGVKRLQSMLSMFGLSPADRARLGVAEVKAQSAFEKLMEKRDERRGDAAG